MIVLAKVAYYYSTFDPPYVKEYRKIRFTGLEDGLCHDRKQQRNATIACEAFMSSVPRASNDLEVSWRVQFPPELRVADQEYALGVFSQMLTEKGKRGSFDHVSIDRETNPLPEDKERQAKDT